jgi:hypothetical protein
MKCRFAVGRRLSLGCARSVEETSVQKISAIQGIPLRGPESGITNDAPQLLFRGAVGDARRADDIFFQHHRTDIISPETQAHLAHLQPLCDPARLHVEDIREIKPRNRQHLQVFNRRRFIPTPSAERRIRRLETPRNECREPARFFLQAVDRVEMIHAVLEGFADAEHHGRAAGRSCHAR